MIVGLIGKNINYSYSSIIHKCLFKTVFNKDIDYKIVDICEFQNLNYFYMNVTIPYKTELSKMCDYVCEVSEKVEAVNLVVFKEEELIGYNTDYLGFKKMCEINEVDLSDKKILILGSGATSRVVRYYLDQLNNSNYDVCSRSNDQYLKYNEVDFSLYQVIINTTPVGTYPVLDESVVDLVNYDGIIIDCIYNPNRTKLLQSNNNPKNLNGLDMLIIQAMYSFAYGIGYLIEHNFDRLFKTIKKELFNLNIVLIGLPYSGKTTIAKKLSQKLNLECYDSDEIITKKYKDIKELISSGDFRSFESLVIKELALKHNCIISTGGGVILNEANMINLKANGIIINIKRDYKTIVFDDSRPLCTNINQYLDLLNQRDYSKYTDFEFENNEVDEVVDKIIMKIEGLKNDYHIK